MSGFFSGSGIGAGGELTAAEELVIQTIADGTYFVFNDTPVGNIDGVNTTFTILYTPNPSSSLQLTLQGQLQIQGTEYTLSESTITMVSAPYEGMVLKAPFYTVSPV